MSLETVMDRKTLEFMLRALAQVLKQNRNRLKHPLEIILVGGAAIVIHHDFRDSTRDVDAWLSSEVLLRQAVRTVGERYGFSERWVNQDFTRTASFTPKLREVSIHYKTYLKVLEVRTIQGPDLIAMKLMSARRYKNDLSDIVGVLMELKKNQQPISLEQVEASVTRLYGSFDAIHPKNRTWIQKVIHEDDYSTLFLHVVEEEQAAQSAVLEAIKDSDRELTEADAQWVLQAIQKKRK